jgi:hypothetical protein
MFKVPSYFVSSVLLFSFTIPVLADEYSSDFSTNPDYSYQTYSSKKYSSYKSPSTSSSSSTRATRSSSSYRTFSGGVMIPRGGSQSSYSTQHSYAPKYKSNTYK